MSWQPIETAPRDGTIIRVWREEFGPRTVELVGHRCAATDALAPNRGDR